MRHGKPEFELTGSVRACDIGGVVRSYDLSGIVGCPPDEAIELTKKQNIVVCSDLPRSLQSAEFLGGAEVYIASPVFGETNLPYFSTGSIKLPVSVWIAVLRSLWFFGFSKNGESLSATKKRAKLASQKLMQLAEQFEKILLVGHGFINRLIARELLSQNWQGPSLPGHHYWDYAVYRYQVS